MKWLDGSELAGYMQAEQATEVRRLKGAWAEKRAKAASEAGIALTATEAASRTRTPKLLILQDHPNKVSELYVNKKLQYAADIGAEAEYKIVETSELANEIRKANADKNVHGVIVQLPLLESSAYEVLNEIAPEKDVDGLNEKIQEEGRDIFKSATAEAINYLLAGYNVELAGKKIAIIGYGRLVGKPLSEMWRAMGLDVTVFRKKDTERLPEALPEFDVVVSGTGVAGLVKSEMLKQGAAVVDAGTATDKNGVSGDFEPAVLERDDLTLTPKVGGVGPVTVATLFSHLLRSARASLPNQ
ncbi:bifunctional 5,10-methylenetetrahydrofolate dehydrogenase/5,10-methenyltetrahydrofolate cyclohydrolase [Candidatus Saccharibacteria bacterium]|nr:bifunctional 5,10-methylenetetrahydrofolate dehydrogenase/5,10-methenyltetrahydrofolate cyclohydrolase [Candidatus Saccharibacteria bacterium]